MLPRTADLTRLELELDPRSAPHTTLIVPTYQRGAAVNRLLQHLGSQASLAAIEVIIVDDGSQLDVPKIDDLSLPFPVRLIRQSNQGATAARNRGALAASGSILVFMDDDILPAADTLPLFLRTLASQSRCIVLGTLVSRTTQSSAPYARWVLAYEQAVLADERHRADHGLVQLRPEQCLTGLLAVRRDDFFSLGQFQDPTGGWPNWDDVDFGYRATQVGYRLLRITDARAEHWDYAISDPWLAADRWYRAAYSAPLLFKRYPELESSISMFQDMGPMQYATDSPIMKIRRIARMVTAVAPVRRALIGIAVLIGHILPVPTLLAPLYRLGMGGYKSAGYRRGLIAAEAVKTSSFLNT